MPIAIPTIRAIPEPSDRENYQANMAEFLTDLLAAIDYLRNVTSEDFLDGNVGIEGGVQAYHASLAALVGLTLTADKLLYVNGAGTMALADFTASARSLLAAANVAAQRTALSVDSSAEVDVKISNSIQAGIAPLYTSPGAGFPTSGNSVTGAHGLGRVPYRVEAVAVCTAANNGYSIGDEVVLGTGSDDPHASSLWQNNVTVGYSVSGGITTTNRASATRFSFAAANWNVILRAW